MKGFIKEFLKRGLVACAAGPIIMAIIYACLGDTQVAAQKVSIEILSTTAMAFIAAGITAIYTIERLPLIWAALIHAVILYADYICVYLYNGWMPRKALSIGIFTAAFVVGYALIWLCIYCSIRKKTKQLNLRIIENS